MPTWSRSISCPTPSWSSLGLVERRGSRRCRARGVRALCAHALVQLRRVREGSQIEEDHMRNRQMIVHWLLANTAAIETRVARRQDLLCRRRRAGLPRRRRRSAVAKCSGSNRKATTPAARALFETYGIHFDPALRDEVVARVKALHLPSYTGFVMPRLDAVRSASGEITDVTISYPMDLTAQMLEYAAATRHLR